MATKADVLSIASAEVGYYAPDDPESGSKYGRWMAEATGEDWLAGPSVEIAWCCMFVSWVLDRAGQACQGFPSYNTDLVLRGDPPLVDVRDCQAGDIVIWDWDGNGATDHVGFVNYRNGDYLQTVEGNHGNRVDVVDRSAYWQKVAAVIRPPYADAGSRDCTDSTSGGTTGDYLYEVACMVCDGEFGNGRERVDRLYGAVQGTVNRLMAGELQQSDNVWVLFANDVIDGLYGNGEQRKANIYAAVQGKVNEILSK